MAKTVWVGLRHHKTQKYELQPFPKQTCVGTYASRYGGVCPGRLLMILRTELIGAWGADEAPPDMDFRRRAEA
jgi:hypothetical protein